MLIENNEFLRFFWSSTKNEENSSEVYYLFFGTLDFDLEGYIDEDKSSPGFVRCVRETNLYKG